LPLGGAVQLNRTVVAFHDGGVVAGNDFVEAKGHRSIEHRFELDFLVTPQAGIWCPALFVFLDEVIDDVCFEPLGKIPHIKRNSQLTSNAPRVNRVFDGAAASGARAEGARHPGQRQMHTHNLVSRVYGTRGRDGAIDTTAHCCENFHGLQCTERPRNGAGRSDAANQRDGRDSRHWESG